MSCLLVLLFTAPTSWAQPITYEEAPRAQEVNPDDLQKVDEALFAGLREAGVGPDRVHFVLQGDQDEVTIMSATLGPQQSVEAVLAALNQRLEHTNAHWRRGSHPGEVDIYLAGNLTHRLLLLGVTHDQKQAPGTVTTEVPSQPPVTPPSSKPRMVLVIDDLGYQLGAAKKLLGLGLNITCSVLPHSPNGVTVARLAHAQGRQVLLHLPMEPLGYPKVNPGPGALMTDMPAERLTQLTRENLDSVPFVVGANNHMGSRFTEDAAALRAPLEVLGERHLFFLDSLTSQRSQVALVARELKLPFLRRDIFLDHQISQPAIERQLNRALQAARSHDGLVVIAHPHPETIAVLAAHRQELLETVTLVPASELLGKPAHLDQ